MSEAEHQRYCGQCGSPLQEGDAFCGNCGAAALPPASQAEQVIPREEAAAAGVGHRLRGRTLALAIVLGALAVLLVGGGALAALTLGDGLGFAGGSGNPPSVEPNEREEENPGGGETTTPPAPAPEETSAPEEISESEETVMVSDPGPDPAFNDILPTLQDMTSTTILLPTDLPDELGPVAIDETTDENGYTILFLDEEAPAGEIVRPFVDAEVDGALVATRVTGGGPEPPDYGPDFAQIPLGEVELPGGTPASLFYYEPTEGNGTPFTLGGFLWRDQSEKSYSYELTLETDTSEGDFAKRVLSSMEPLMVQEGNDEAGTAETGPGDPQDFVSEYYAEVAERDWSGTYALLDSASRAEFTEDEWFEVQERRVAQTNPPTVESATVQATSGEDPLTATALLSYEDGSTETLDIELSLEGEEYRRSLTDEEVEFLRGL